MQLKRKAAALILVVVAVLVMLALAAPAGASKAFGGNCGSGSFFTTAGDDVITTFTRARTRRRAIVPLGS